MNRRLLLALTIIPAALAAQAPAPRPVGVVVDLGYVSSSGNTELTTFSIGEKLTWKARPRLTLAQSLRAVYGKASDSVTANSLNAGVAADYTMFANLGVTAGVAYERNRFAGVARRLEEALGLVRPFSLSSVDSLRIEAGAVWTQQRGIDDVDNDFVAARAAFWYKRTLRRGAYLQETFEALPNLETSDDWRINSETALVAPISARIGLKLSYVVRYDNQPEPTFKPSDRVMTAGLQITY